MLVNTSQVREVGTHAFLDDGKVERVDDTRLPLWFFQQSPAVFQVDEHAEPVGGFGQSDEVVDLVLGRVAMFLLVGVGVLGRVSGHNQMFRRE